MQLTKKHISDFQSLFLEHFNERLDERMAYEKGMRLIRLMKIIYKPMTEIEYQQLQERRRETGDL